MEAVSCLALEDERNYGDARGDLKISDLVNNPNANGICSVLGLLLDEEGLDLSRGQLGSLVENRADSLLVS